LAFPAGVLEVRCPYCSTVTQRDAPAQERAYEPVPVFRSPLPFVIAGSVVVLGLAVVLFVVAVKSEPQVVPSSPVKAPEVPKPQAAPPEPEAPAKPAPEETAKPKEAEIPAEVERGPVTLIWTGKVQSSTGAPARAGSACTLTARVTSNGDRVHEDLLSFQCGGQVLYDSSLPLEGMSSSSFGVGEEPVSGQARAFQYVIEAGDVGTRSGPKSQISVNSRAKVIQVFRDTVPAFRVQASLERDSQVRRGRPLFTEMIPPFEQVVTRKAKVVSRTGAVPFSAAACSLVVAPAYSKGDTCRVTLTCGGKVVYGAGTSGYDRCLVADGRPTSFVDANPTPSGGDPQLQADLLTNTASLGDTAPSGASYSVQFSLAP
jgi:hypothetical protein